MGSIGDPAVRRQENLRTSAGGAVAFQIPPVLALVAAAEELDHLLHVRVDAVHRVELGQGAGEGRLPLRSNRRA